MIRNHPSGDLFTMAVSAAKREIPITPEQEDQFIKAVLHEAKKSFWPPGFF